MNQPSAKTRDFWASLRVNVAIAVGLAACPLVLLAGVAADYWA